MVGVTMRSALAAATMAAASVKKKKKRRLLLLRCSVNAGIGAGAGAGADASGGKADGGGTRDWSRLPDPAVYLIPMGLLPALADVFSSGSVCKAWRSVFMASKRELFLAVLPVLVDRGSSPGALDGFFNFRERRFCRRKQPIDWPWIHADTYLLMAEMNVIGVSHGYWIVHTWSSLNQGGPVFLMDPLSPEVRIDLPRAPHNVRYAFMTVPPTSPGCVIVATEVDCTLYCRPGDTEWARHSFREGDGHDGSDASDTRWMAFQEHQVAALGREVYALARNGRLVIMELCFPRPRVSVVEAKGLPRRHNSCALLVESNGEILYIADEGRVKLGPDGSLIRGLPCRQEHKYVVRRLDLPALEWVTLNTLGDRSLFLNGRVATSLSCGAARWGGGGDRIYSHCLFSEAMLVFHMKDGRVEHHPMPEQRAHCDWLIPSFCYS